MASWNGRQFGKYIIHEEVGRGGMARVFRATDTTLQRAVALKVLSAQLANDPDASQRFAREAITAANLRHPNIVTIFDVGEIEGIPYIAMEYIAGRTLQAVIDERGAMGLGYAVALLEPVAEALDFAHTQQLVHRDIKPHNILINADGRVLLTDFGIAQAPVAGGQRLTRSGMFMGTPEYIAPEQAAAQPVDGRSDLYSLGIVAFEVITGQVPFSGSVPELLVAHAYTAPPPISTVVAGMPPALDKVFARALAKKPDERPPSAIALVDALRSLCVRSGGIIPDRSEVAALAIPRGSSAGKETMALPAAAQLPPAVPPRQSNPSAATDVGSITPPPRVVPPRNPAAPQPASRPTPQSPPPTRAAAPRPPARPVERPVARPRTQTRAQPRRSATTSDPIKTVFPFIFAGLLVVLGIVYWQRSDGPGLVATPFPSNVITNGGGGLSGTVGVVETRIPTAIPTDTPAPTGVPTVASTLTAEPPTTEPPTAAPPTAAPPPPTARPASPTARPRPSATPRPAPTAAPPPPTAVPPPTDVPAPPTEVPPTEAPPPTDVPLPTVTPELTTQTLPPPVEPTPGSEPPPTSALP